MGFLPGGRICRPRADHSNRRPGLVGECAAHDGMSDRVREIQNPNDDFRMTKEIQALSASAVIRRRSSALFATGRRWTVCSITINTRSKTHGAVAGRGARYFQTGEGHRAPRPATAPCVLERVLIVIEHTVHLRPVAN